MEERRMWSHESLTLDLKSIPWKNTKDGRESIHYSIHLHFTRVVHEQPRPNIADTRFISPHSSRIIPKTNPYPTTYTPAYPSSRTPVPLFLLARGSRAAWVSPEGEIDASGVCSLHSCCCYSIPKGWQFFLFSSFFLLRRSNGMERRRGLEWKRDATKTKRRTFNERARDGVADRPRLNRADSEHVGLEWAWLSDGDGRSGSERDGQRSAGGWSGLVKWG